MPTTELWSASTILRIHPDEPSFHCMGYAKTTTDGCCHNPVKQANRAAAAAIIDSLCFTEPNSSEARRLLRHLAPLILCVRWHRSQEEQLYCELRRRTRAFLTPEQDEVTYAMLRGWQPRRIIESQALMAPVPPTFVNRMERRAEGARASQVVRHTLAQAAERGVRTTSQRPTSRPASSNGEAESSGVAQNATAVASSTSSGGMASAGANSGGGAPQIQTQPRTATLTTSTTTTTTTTPPTSPSRPPPSSSPAPRSDNRTTPSRSLCNVRHVSRRPTNGECAICYASMERRENLKWCKAQCGQNFHQECFNMWERQLRDDGEAIRCPYCRTEWAPPCSHDLCDVEHATRRSIATECTICTESMQHGQEVVWCKAQCGQNFHKECFEPWAAEQRAAQSSATCPCCRTAWAPPCVHDEA